MGQLEELREANASRMRRWHGESEWTGADWSNAMCGEAGEAANVVKKIRRHETSLAHPSYNTPPLDDLHSMLADELADVVIYIDLLAHHYGIELWPAIQLKFNAVSRDQDFPERLGPGNEFEVKNLSRHHPGEPDA